MSFETTLGIALQQADSTYVGDLRVMQRRADTLTLSDGTQIQFDPARPITIDAQGYADLLPPGSTDLDHLVQWAFRMHRAMREDDLPLLRLAGI